MWMNIREVDLSSGQVKSTLFEHYLLTDILSKNFRSGSVVPALSFKRYPAGTMVAARCLRQEFKQTLHPDAFGWTALAGSDAKGGTAKFLYRYSSVLKVAADPKIGANNVTRMTIGVGNGYAITNSTQSPDQVYYRKNTCNPPTW